MVIFYKSYTIRVVFLIVMLFLRSPGNGLIYGLQQRGILSASLPASALLKILVDGAIVTKTFLHFCI